MSVFFADTSDQITFGVQASNMVEVGNFSSTLDEMYLRMFTNNNMSFDNVVTGAVIGSSNYDKTPSARNSLFLGTITDSNILHKTLFIEQDRVGIDVEHPTASLHVVGSNLTYSNVFRVETVNSPAFPAVVVDKYGHVGIGTESDSNQLLRVGGLIAVDDLAVGLRAAGSNLIKTYGLTPPAGEPNLNFNYANVSNIQNVFATNLTQLFTNIGNHTFIDNATVSVGTIAPTGATPFTINFNGNSTSYTYTYTVTSNSYTHIISPTTVATSSHTQTVTFPTGTYNVAFSISTPGVGAGSTYSLANAATFTVGATDNVGAPSVTVGPVSLNFTGSTVSVSGIPYYANNVQVTFPVGSLLFTNMYNTINPIGIVTPAVTLKDVTNNTNTTSYSYNQLFSDVTAYSGSNTNNVTINLTSLSTSSLVNLSSTVYNINNQSGIVNNTLVTGIAYLGSNINESTMDVAMYNGMSITSVRRLSLSASSGTPLTFVIGTELSSYNGSPSAYDSWYSPYNNGHFYNISSSIPRGTYAPSWSIPAGTHNYLTFVINCSAPINSFVLNLTGASTITNLNIAWASVNNGQWYDATIIYTSGGCAASTFSSGTRFPITLPAGITPLISATNIYVNVKFSGNIPLSGITISNT